MTIWHVAIEVDAGEIPVETQTHIGDRLEATTSRDEATGRLTARMSRTAGTVRQAADTALRDTRAALTAAGVSGHPAGIHVLPEDEWIADAEHPAPARLLGIAETARLLGVSRQRVAELMDTHPEFPAPLARLASGPVFSRDSVVAFTSRWERRRTGRPRKTA